jgi:hypothetical protein
MVCTNCKGKHFAYSRECPKWKTEKQVQQIKIEKRLSYPEARKIVETITPVAAGKSYAAAVKVSTISITTQTDLTWPIGEDKFKKISDIERAQRQAAKAAQKQSSKMTQVSSGSLNPPRSSTGEPGSSRAMTGKDTKPQHKDCCSDRLKKIEKKSIPISNSYDPLNLDVDDMDVSSHENPQPRPPPKPKDKAKITPVLPPDDK